LEKDIDSIKNLNYNSSIQREYTIKTKRILEESNSRNTAA